MSDLHKGSCLCKGVEFEVSGNFSNFFLCHCKYCQKDTGSAHAAVLFSNTATLSWIKGQELVRSYNLPETRHVKTFCSHCGSALPFNIEAAKMIMVPAGSLDCDIKIQPTSHIFMASKANWDNNLHSIAKVDSFPAS